MQEWVADERVSIRNPQAVPQAAWDAYWTAVARLATAVDAEQVACERVDDVREEGERQFFAAGVSVGPDPLRRAVDSARAAARRTGLAYLDVVRVLYTIGGPLLAAYEAAMLEADARSTGLVDRVFCPHCPQWVATRYAGQVFTWHQAGGKSRVRARLRWQWARRLHGTCDRCGAVWSASGSRRMDPGALPGVYTAA